MKISATKYVTLCLLVPLLLVGLTGPINYYFDPFGLYHYGVPGDWIESRPALQEYMALHKTHAVETAQADILFLGNSRTDEGLDPTCKVLPGHAYNLAIGGSHVYENFRELQHASFFHVPKTVVLGVDIFFFDGQSKSGHLVEEDRMAVRPDGQPNPFYPYADLASTLFSMSALHECYSMVMNPPDAPITFSNGFQGDVSLVLAHLDHPYIQWRANREFMPAEPITFTTVGNSEWEAFVDLVHFCAAHHIQLLVFVQPVHAMLLDVYMGNRDDYSTWLRDVTHTLDAESGLASEFWDFSGYNDLTAERFPAPSEPISTMQYYWNCAHYKPKVGDMILQRLFAHQGLPGFGYQVTQATVEQDLQRVYGEKGAYENGKPLPSVSDPFPQP